jgi:hypothetical protein
VRAVGDTGNFVADATRASPGQVGFDLSGSYHTPFLAVAVIALLGLILSVILRPVLK